MNRPNTIIKLDVERLRAALDTLQPMQLCAYSVKLVNVPEEARNLTITIFKGEGEYFQPVPCTQDSNGDWFCDLLGFLFPTAGEFQYQIAMEDDNGHRFAGGKGKVLVEPFEVTSGGEVTPEGDIILTEIPDETGKPHRVKAVNRGTKEQPDWSWQIED